MENIIGKEKGTTLNNSAYYFNFTFSWGYFYFSAGCVCFPKKFKFLSNELE